MKYLILIILLTGCGQIEQIAQLGKSVTYTPPKEFMYSGEWEFQPENSQTDLFIPGTRIKFNEEKRIIEGLQAYGLYPSFDDVEPCAESNILFVKCIWFIEGQFALHYDPILDNLEMWNRTTTTKYGTWNKR